MSYPFHKISALSSKQSKLLFLALTLLIAGLLVVYLFDYQRVMAQGDHGRDFYCFKKAVDGAVPYHDYWWVYGPLMPYYYGLFFKLFGITMQSILIGKFVVILLGVVFVYLILATVSPPLFAFMGALWFFNFSRDFFYTYNHIGGLVMILGCVYCIFSYMRNPRPQYFYFGLFFIFLTSLIKINFGLTTLLCFLISLVAIDKIKGYPLTRQKFITCALFSGLLLTLIAGIYYILLSDLPIHVIRQCFPYLSADQPYNSTPGYALHVLIKSIMDNIKTGWPNLAFAFLIILSIVQTVITVLNKKTDLKTRQDIVLTVMILSLFYVVNMHEFLKSAVYYRVAWSLPFSIMLIFVIISFATENLTRLVRSLFTLSILSIIFIMTYDGIAYLKLMKRPETYLGLKRGKIYLGNQPGWIQTVTQTTEYLEKNLSAVELFFALPYDPIYYYLTGKDSPTRQLIFFVHINIPPEQEKNIIAELEKKKVNWIVLSNRSNSPDPTNGILGVTYCPLIGDYIQENFQTEAQFGEWVLPEGWAHNHGTRILKRIHPIL